ncbi:hypothetical protein QJS04_geneDACA005032 [Acorus gramineus]|uniref:Uncharacterized protein n=1 Tax=Acorus gramineus TaxID=55184 RepID=A0AAV9B0J9_ACOGR|nr:hypothetical protein QJS04_geneDACA005032 [Acorus gramineus]
MKSELITVHKTEFVSCKHVKKQQLFEPYGGRFLIIWKEKWVIQNPMLDAAKIQRDFR